MKKLITILLLLLSLPVAAEDKEIYLECKSGLMQYNLLLNLSKNAAIQFGPIKARNRTGKLEVYDNYYVVFLPSLEETEQYFGYLESRIEINRITRSFKAESGEPPLILGNKDNYSFSGECKMHSDKDRI